jgi:argininosuccinate lyase
LGKKVHAGRSRNDQVLVTTRLHLRDALIKLLQRLHRSILILHAKHQEIGQVEFPGYTHMQPAMPSSLGMWLHSQMEGLLELIREGLSLYSLVNINPLGVSAGFGSNIPLDKAYTSEQLGFARFHRSPIDGNNSRGRYESRLMHYCVTVADILEKAACDLMMYTMKEFAFLKLPDSMVTGSSIMPQKKNYDIAELLRGRGAKVRSAAAEIDLIKMKLTSSYNRDFQYVKEPSLRGLEEINFMLDMYDLIMTHLEVNEENCSKALPDDIYSTYYANTLSLNKVPYRTAYKQVAQEVADGSFDSTEHKEEFKKVQVEMEAYVKECLNELKGLAQKVEKWSADLAEKFRGLLGG